MVLGGSALEDSSCLRQGCRDPHIGIVFGCFDCVNVEAPKRKKVRSALQGKYTIEFPQVWHAIRFQTLAAPVHLLKQVRLGG